MNKKGEKAKWEALKLLHYICPSGETAQQQYISL